MLKMRKRVTNFSEERQSFKQEFNTYSYFSLSQTKITRLTTKVVEKQVLFDLLTYGAYLFQWGCVEALSSSSM